MNYKVILKSIALATLMLSINGCLGGDSKEDTNKQTVSTTQSENEKDSTTSTQSGDTLSQTTEEANTTKPVSETTTTNPTETDVATTEDNVTTQTQEVNSTKEETNTKNETNTTTETTKPQIDSITLSSSKTNLLKDESIALNIKDKKGNDIKNNITWIVNPTNSIKQSSTNTIIPIKDTTITLRAKHNNIISNPITLHVKWIINGHTLPPKPNEKTNNSTLLGIDTNNNGVRDDVERWIYETYKDKHPIHIDIAMQAGRAYKKVLQMPERALEIHDEVSAPLDCQFYYKYDAKFFNEKILMIDDVVSRYFRHEIYFNTKQRYRVYYDEYDRRLSGHVFTLLPMNKEKEKCGFDTSKYNETEENL